MTPAGSSVSFGSILVAASLLSCGPSQLASPLQPRTGGAASDRESTTSSSPNSRVATLEDGTAGNSPATLDVGLADVGLDPEAMDRSADPCSDFFRYACGGWLDDTPIPAGRASHDRFAELEARTAEVLEQILERARTAGAPDPETARLGGFYGACMDEEAIAKAGLSALEPLLAVIRRIRRPRDVVRAVAKLHRRGVWAAFTWGVHPDLSAPDTEVLWVDRGGLGLPDRDDYLEDGGDHAEARAFYRGHVERMFRLAGNDHAAARTAASDVLRIETQLARATRTRTQRRDIQRMYNPYDRGALARLTPRFDWDVYFEVLGGSHVQRVIATTPAYLSRLDVLLKRNPGRIWTHYLEWQLLHHMAEYLPTAFADEHAALRAKLTGRTARPPRWRRCVQATDRALGELLGRRYVAEVFSGESKRAVETLVAELSRAFVDQLASVTWMGEATKKRALAKLRQMRQLVGHPDSWRTYGFAVDRRNHARSVLAARVDEVAWQLRRLARPRDRREWSMSPYRVEVHYSPLDNRLVIPAGVLQSPLFGAGRSIAVNLGSLGAIVGHELTHGFDDAGALFGATGELRGWWQDDDLARFEASGQCLATHYAAFEPVPGVRVNGMATLGESIADLGGVRLAFRAYRRLRENARQVQRAAGLGEDQQFFVAFAQAWCGKSRDADLGRTLAIDSHAPPRFRVMGTLQNLSEFGAAFGCVRGTPMRPAATCQIW